MIERQRQRQRVIEDFKAFYRPVNRTIAKTDPTASIFDRVEKLLKKKPDIIFANPQS